MPVVRYKSTGKGPSRAGGGVVNVKRLVGFLVIALLIYAVIVNPTASANTVQSIGNILKNAADSITAFFQQLL